MGSRSFARESITNPTPFSKHLDALVEERSAGQERGPDKKGVRFTYPVALFGLVRRSKSGGTSKTGVKTGVMVHFLERVRHSNCIARQIPAGCLRKSTLPLFCRPLFWRVNPKLRLRTRSLVHRVCAIWRPRSRKSAMTPPIHDAGTEGWLPHPTLERNGEGSTRLLLKGLNTNAKNRVQSAVYGGGQMGSHR